VQDFEIIFRGACRVSEKLAEKPVIVVATKLDADDRPTRSKSPRFLRRTRLEFRAISSASERHTTIGPRHR